MSEGKGSLKCLLGFLHPIESLNTRDAVHSPPIITVRIPIQKFSIRHRNQSEATPTGILFTSITELVPKVCSYLLHIFHDLLWRFEDMVIDALKEIITTSLIINIPSSVSIIDVSSPKGFGITVSTLHLKFPANRLDVVSHWKIKGKLT